MKRFTLLFFILLSGSVYSQERDVYTILTVFDGPGFRPAALFNSTEISIERLSTNGAFQRDQGLSMDGELLGSGNYCAGIKYYRTIFSKFSLLYGALQPCIYSTNDAKGWNIRPEIGFLYDPVWQYVVGLRIKLDYAYDIPLNNSRGFAYNRSVLEVKLGITFNIHHKTSY